MKSAEDWAYDVRQGCGLGHQVVEAIREEMRQEIKEDVTDALKGVSWQDDAIKAIDNAGKPTLRKGQLVIADDGIRSTEDIFIYMEQGIDTKGFRPLQWSDLCDEDGMICLIPSYDSKTNVTTALHPVEDGPVYLKEAMI